jgi:phosphate transport system protein
MADTHTVKSYDDELSQLTAKLLRMGGLAESQLASAIQAITKRDIDLAERVIKADRAIDEHDAEVTAGVTRILALRQPMAVDLRVVVGALRLAIEIERIGDYAANIAKRAIAIAQAAPVRQMNAIPRMGGLVQAMIKDVLDALANRDAAKAEEVWRRDGEVDEIYNSLFRELLTYMLEDPRTITSCTHLLFIAKNIERIGDHATNIAEEIYFMVKGARLAEDRPKSDTTSAFAGPDAPTAR